VWNTIHIWKYVTRYIYWVSCLRCDFEVCSLYQISPVSLTLATIPVLFLSCIMYTILTFSLTFIFTTVLLLLSPCAALVAVTIFSYIYAAFLHSTSLSLKVLGQGPAVRPTHYLCVCQLCACVCVCVCVRACDRERERESNGSVSTIVLDCEVYVMVVACKLYTIP
jgi:hypothetical protein